MIRLSVLIGFGLVAMACGKDPARDIKVAQATPAVAETTVIPWHADACSPVDELPGGASTLVAKGTCNFEQHAAVSCHQSVDDFYLVGSRKTKLGATLMIYINIEHYAGPGDYDEAQMYAAIQGDDAVYRWSNDSVHMTVGKGEAFATLPKSILAPETPAVGTEEVSGKLMCEGGGTTSGTDAGGWPVKKP